MQIKSLQKIQLNSESNVKTTSKKSIDASPLKKVRFHVITYLLDAFHTMS